MTGYANPSIKEHYKIRFTPRKPDSHWSKKNIKIVEGLIEERRMRPPGMEAFKQMDEDNARQASYDRKEIKLKKEYEQQIWESEEAWTFFQEASARLHA